MVAAAGVAVRAPLARVPENTLKFIVGIMLTAFGMFWGAEGAGAQWPGSDAALLVLVPAVALFAVGLVAALRRAAPGRRQATGQRGRSGPGATGGGRRERPGCGRSSRSGTTSSSATTGGWRSASCSAWP